MRDSVSDSGDAAAALAPLREAKDRFRVLADAGNRDAARMVSAAITKTADCLRALGRIDEAADAYEEAIKLDEERGDARDVAVGKGQLGMVRMLQHRYPEALAAYENARQTFERLGELRTVAVVWHQIGIVHQGARQYDEAEKVYQASLQLKVQSNDRSGAASTLGQLGTLYEEKGRPEDAVRFYQQAATVYRELNDLAGEGRSCSNLAVTLFGLGRYDDARREILRAIECDESFGHTAEPWKTFAILTKIEQATGNVVAASAARQRAIDAYLAYRRDGGENLSGGARIFNLVSQAVVGNHVPGAEAQLTQLQGRADLPGYLKALLPKLLAILHGARAASLADDPELDYDDAAELQLLLEHLARDQSAGRAEREGPP